MYVYKGNPRNMTVKLPNFGTTTTGKLKKPTKKQYKCKGGALDGQTLWLSSPPNNDHEYWWSSWLLSDCRSWIKNNRMV